MKFFVVAISTVNLKRSMKEMNLRQRKGPCPCRKLKLEVQKFLWSGILIDNLGTVTKQSKSIKHDITGMFKLR